MNKAKTENIVQPGEPIATTETAVGVPLDGPDEKKVTLRVLDKVTLRTREFELAMDQSVRFGIIDITVRECTSSPPTERPEASAFIQIDESRQARKRQRIFSGWMFASTPSLNPLQHPIYDVWVVKCNMSFPDKGPDTVEVGAAASSLDDKATEELTEDGKPKPKPKRKAAAPAEAVSAPEPEAPAIN
jgi:hypothetical protein